MAKEVFDVCANFCRTTFECRLEPKLLRAGGSVYAECKPLYAELVPLESGIPGDQRVDWIFECIAPKQVHGTINDERIARIQRYCTKYSPE